MADPTKVQKAYLAGYIDGEGCIGWYNSPSLQVESCHPEPMRFMQSLYGGEIRSRKRTGAKQTPRTVYTLRYYADSCIMILEHLIPFLIEKKQQAEAILQMRKLKKKVYDEKHKDHGERKSLAK
jgi:hypothetical protein